ncbi:methyl-accepting chemotaxis protein [Desulfoplanes formicivorans]|uniref:Chemotaxis protein n=1 Tax=Desulfoplanes formicivorans TaxID=1592317 RepID=A0A194AIX8_9BACT|nr:methyl-accepting chemotaxis protein [Desulfoplanes formicivorans]GAU09283.1 chemotaxis protein [Desulfoplanes formicivorans]
MKQGIRVSFRVRIMLMIIVAMVAVSVGTVTSVGLEMRKILTNTNRENIGAIKKIIDARVSRVLREIEGYATLTARDERVIKGLVQEDTSGLQTYGQALISSMSLDFITLVDREGIVVARGHAAKHGDSQAGKYIVRQALQGHVAVGIARGNLIRFSFRAAAPVYDHNQVVGAVLLGYNLSSLPFVDAIKKDMQVECTVFDKTKRVATTIVDESGKRVVGTVLTNKDIAHTVLNEGEIYEGENQLFGAMFDTVYWPIRDLGGQIQGMLFIGKDRAPIVQDIWYLIWFLAVVIVGISLVVAVVTLVVAGKLTRPVKTCIAFAKEIAQGRLDTVLNVHRNDDLGELAQALKTMVAKLKKLIEQAEAEKKQARMEKEKADQAMREAVTARKEAEHARAEGMQQAAQSIEGIVERLTSASEELAAQSEQVTQGTTLQSTRTQETATSVEQMNATVLEVAKNASRASLASKEAKQNALTGKEVVARAVDSINKVHKQAQTMKSNLDKLGSEADGIGQILNVISDIADQTNLLALNAAIEAARAGDAGRGFAVVADEVRKLAEKTMQATKEVGVAVKSIQQGTEINIKNMDVTAQVVTQTTELANQAGNALNEIVTSSEEMFEQITSIATASEEQSTASEEISKSIEDINQVTQETAQGMQQTRDATVELASLAAQLGELVQEFRSR